MRLARAQRQVAHALGLLDRLTDPDGRRELRRVADEPALLAVVRRTGLAGGVAADAGDATRRTAGQHALEGLGDAARDVLVDGRWQCDFGTAYFLPVALVIAVIATGRQYVPLGGERRVARRPWSAATISCCPG